MKSQVRECNPKRSNRRFFPRIKFWCPFEKTHFTSLNTIGPSSKDATIIKIVRQLDRNMMGIQQTHMKRTQNFQTYKFFLDNNQVRPTQNKFTDKCKIKRGSQLRHQRFIKQKRWATLERGVHKVKLRYK